MTTTTVTINTMAAGLIPLPGRLVDGAGPKRAAAPEMGRSVGPTDLDPEPGANEPARDWIRG